MPSWELTLAEVRGMSMPLAPDSMTEEKWAKLKAAQNNTSSTETYLLVHDLIPSILAYHKHAQDALNYSYQLAGAVGAGVEALDNLSAVVHGEAPPHPWPVAESAELQRAEEIRAAAVKVHEVFYRRAPGYFTEVECRVLDNLRAALGVK